VLKYRLKYLSRSSDVTITSFCVLDPCFWSIFEDAVPTKLNWDTSNYPAIFKFLGNVYMKIQLKLRVVQRKNLLLYPG